MANESGPHPRPPPKDLRIRAQRLEDQAAISGVEEAAFGSPVEARVVSKIRASANFVPELSLVAELDGTIVCHVMISWASQQDEEVHRRIANLSPLAVAPQFRRQGIGTALVREVTRRADRRQEPLVVLEGSPRFYGPLGFEPSARYGIRMTLPSWAPPEAAQVLRLRNYDPILRGLVVYPPAFDEAIEH